MELSENFIIPTNEFQTEITKELLSQYPDEVVEQFLDCVSNIKFIQNLISPNRRRAKDLPRDSQGRIIVDLENPHIVENVDYFRQRAIFFKEHGCYTNLRPNPNPNSEYRKMFDEEIRRCREGYVRESDGEWVTGYCYYYMNYCPIMLTKIVKGRKKASRVEDFPEFWEGIYWRFHYLYKAREHGHHAIELARRGAHPYTEKVFTPNGWKLWEDIKIGDKLYGTNGKETTVIDIPYDKEAPYYKITLRDGREVTASDDHLWVVQEGHKKYLQTVSTEQLLSMYIKSRKVSDRIPSGKEYDCFIVKNNGVDMNSRVTKVDPYTFGLLLGDGCFRHESCYFTQLDTDIKEEAHYIPYTLTKWSGKYAYRIGIPNWKTIIKDYNLWYKKSEDKFIPDEYKYNSRSVRLNLLKGLFDSDGHIHGGVPTLSTTSERLKDDVLEIARSLGYNASFTKQKAGYKKEDIYVECLPVYSISVYAGAEIFNLTRKKEKVKYESGNAKSRKLKTAITNIEYLVDEKNGVVYRIANHWGKCASCDWYIRFKGKKDGYTARDRYILAKCNFSDFIRKEGFSPLFVNPEYVKANINAVEKCLKKIKYHLDSGVVFSKSAKNELINSWNVCKNSMSKVSESMKDSVKRLQDEYEKLFEE